MTKESNINSEEMTQNPIPYSIHSFPPSNNNTFPSIHNDSSYPYQNTMNQKSFISSIPSSLSSWNCPMCTFLNNGNSTTCEICAHEIS